MIEPHLEVDVKQLLLAAFRYLHLSASHHQPILTALRVVPRIFDFQVPAVVAARLFDWVGQEFMPWGHLLGGGCRWKAGKL